MTVDPNEDTQDYGLYIVGVTKQMIPYLHKELKKLTGLESNSVLYDIRDIASGHPLLVRFTDGVWFFPKEEAIRRARYFQSWIGVDVELRVPTRPVITGRALVTKIIESDLVIDADHTGDRIKEFLNEHRSMTTYHKVYSSPPQPYQREAMRQMGLASTSKKSSTHGAMLKTPGGDLLPSCSHSSISSCEERASEMFTESAWSRLKDAGYTIVQVEIREL